MYQVNINTEILQAIKCDSVADLTAVDDWQSMISMRGDAVFQILLENRAIKCVDAVLTHCMDGDVNTGWTHEAFDGYGIEKKRSNTVGAVTQEADIDYLKVYFKHAERRSINLDNPVMQPERFVPPIALAVYTGRIDVLMLFVDHRPMLNLNASCPGVLLRGVTLLMLAVQRRSTELIALLLSAGDRVNVNAVDDDGNTALHWAVKYELIDLVESLLIDKTDVTIRNNSGRTAVQLAPESIQKSIQKFIAERRRRKVVEAEETEKKRIAELEEKPKFMSPVKPIAKTSIEITQKNVDKTSLDTVSTVPSDPVVDRSTRMPSCKSCSVTCANIVLHPCNHLALCVDCRDEARKNKQFNCPACKQRVFLYRQVR